MIKTTYDDKLPHLEIERVYYNPKESYLKFTFGILGKGMIIYSKWVYRRKKV